MNITKRQMDVMQFIESFTDEHNHPPTIEEISDGIGVESKGVAHGHLSRLRDKGMVTWQKKKTRTIKLTDIGNECVRRDLPF